MVVLLNCNFSRRGCWHSLNFQNVTSFIFIRFATFLQLWNCWLFFKATKHHIKCAEKYNSTQTTKTERKCTNNVYQTLVCSVLQHTHFSGVCCVVSDISALTSTPPPPPPSSEGAAANSTEKPIKLGRLPKAGRTSPPLVSSTSHPSNPSHFQVEVTFHLKHQQFSSWGSPRP